MANAAFILGPELTLVETLTPEEVARRRGGAAACVSGRETPLLLRSLAEEWPAFDRWTFSRLARLKSGDGGVVLATFQNGLVEQGATEAPLRLPVSPYLRDLNSAAAALQQDHFEAAARAQHCLLPSNRHRVLSDDQVFHVNWAHMRSFQPDRVYLAGWPLVQEYPSLARDVAPLAALWAGRRGAGTASGVRLWAGPSRTVTGLHAHPATDVLAAQLRGIKEWLLFPPEATPLLRPTRKYSPGGGLCAGVDITNLGADVPMLRSFERARGVFARTEPGDVLLVPAGWWHAAISAEPSLTACSTRRAGGACAPLADALAGWAHDAGWRRAGWCTCHETRDADWMDATPLLEGRRGAAK